MTSACNAIATVLVTMTNRLRGFKRLNLNKLTHKKEAANDTPGKRISMGMTTRKVKISLNDVGERRFERIQSAMMPNTIKKPLDMPGFRKVQGVLISTSSVCCSKIIAPL